MMIYKCDLCKKEIKKENNQIVAGADYNRFTFCQKCGQPILKFLEKHNLVKRPE
ncbi:MAG: hypothetical protein AAB653_02805 [Patescibacteria group bacterium]